MRLRHFGVTVTAALLATALLSAQDAPARSAKAWDGRHAEFEAFLRTSPFQRIEEIPIGVTKPRRGFFEAGGLAESAAWKVLPPGRSQGYWENYKSEIAAYELDKLLGLGMVPPTVEKQWKGALGAAVLWLKEVRPWKEVERLPRPPHWDLEVVRMKMFDNLIGNADRNAGNLLVDHQWNLYLIDHSRAFIGDSKLPAEHQRIDVVLWEKFLALDEAKLAPVAEWVGRGAVRAMLKRRDRMKVVIDDLVRKRTEAAVFIK
jgi:hypothetical protein